MKLIKSTPILVILVVSACANGKAFGPDSIKIDTLYSAPVEGGSASSVGLRMFEGRAGEAVSEMEIRQSLAQSTCGGNEPTVFSVVDNEIGQKFNGVC